MTAGSLVDCAVMWAPAFIKGLLSHTESGHAPVISPASGARPSAQTLKVPCGHSACSASSVGVKGLASSTRTSGNGLRADRNAGSCTCSSPETRGASSVWSQGGLCPCQADGPAPMVQVLMGRQTLRSTSGDPRTWPTITTC